MKKKVIQTEKAPQAIGPYSQAIQAGNLFFISGQIPVDPITLYSPSHVTVFFSPSGGLICTSKVIDSNFSFGIEKPMMSICRVLGGRGLLNIISPGGGANAPAETPSENLTSFGTTTALMESGGAVSCWLRLRISTLTSNILRGDGADSIFLTRKDTFSNLIWGEPSSFGAG